MVLSLSRGCSRQKGRDIFFEQVKDSGLCRPKDLCNGIVFADGKTTLSDDVPGIHTPVHEEERGARFPFSVKNGPHQGRTATIPGQQRGMEIRKLLSVVP